MTVGNGWTDAREPRVQRSRARRGIGLWVVASLVASMAVVTAVAPATSSAQISQPSNGLVIRDGGPFTIREDRGGQYVGEGTSAASKADAAARTTGCNGSSASKPQATSTITVTKADTDAVVHSASHTTANKDHVVLIVTLGDAVGANAAAPWTTSWDTTNAEPGFYNITSTNTDVKGLTFTNSLGVPVVATTCATNPPVSSTVQVEYRPWQVQKFNDFFGGGKVRFNTNPSEFQYTVSGQSSAVTDGSTSMTYYSAPQGLLTLGGDPSSCTTDPVGCLPPHAVKCVPANGCTPQLVVINHQAPGEKLLGIFELSTGAFAAQATVGGKTRVLSSAGTDVDGLLHQTLDQTFAAFAGQGIDLVSVLGQDAQIYLGGQTYEITVLQGIQILDALPDGIAGNGLRLINDRGTLLDFSKANGGSLSLGAGFVDHTAAYGTADILACALGTKPHPVTSIRTETTNLLPEVPASATVVSALAVPLVNTLPVPPEVKAILGDSVIIAPGPLTSIHLEYVDGTGSHTAGHGSLLGTLSTGPNVDVHQGGITVPGLNADATIPDQGPMDFLGYPLLVLDLGCLGHTLVGDGLAVYGGLPVDIGALPLLWDTDNPAIADLNAQIGSLGADALSLLGDPQVSSVVAAALSLIGAGTPTLAAVTAALGGTGSFADLLAAVLNGGTGSVDGLSAALAGLGIAIPTVPGVPPLGDLGGVLAPVLGLLGL
jgi:hypothetical protein